MTYCDFYNNASGNFTGSSITPGLGTINSVNHNGAPCDSFFNIYLDPQFQSVIGDSAFRLTAGSPCIDAGDPASLLDPDSTIADIGANYYCCGPSITLTPENPPVVIPSGGGYFHFGAVVVNPLAQNYFLDIWSEVIIPNGSVFGPLILRQGLTIPGNSTLIRRLTQLVPGYAPYGEYTYVGKIGIYPDSVINRSSFEFSILAGDAPPADNPGWAVYGWDYDGACSPQVEDYTMLTAAPNPFNAETVARFELRDASHVRLAIYDITGREVAVIAEGFYPAGTHQAVWDASSMASGVYFACLQAKGYKAMKKLVLLK